MTKLNFFYRVDKDGFPVPGSLQRFNQKPSNGQWRLLDYSNGICCAPVNNSEIDVFLIAGQSNAKGRATDAPSPTITGNSILQVNNGVISLANDPVGVGSSQAVNYSAWPQFGITYNQLTGRNIAFTPSAVSGTSQVAAADIGNGNWSPTGGLYNLSISRVTSTINALKQAGYTPIFKGILWLQGETDADGINNSTIIQADYSTGLQQMIANYRSVYGSTMPFYIIRIGTRVGSSDVGYSQVRDTQVTIAEADPYTKVIYYGAVDFPARNLMGDQYHYKVAAYNEIGRIGAFEVVNF
jgi:hypothetical protein